MDDHQSLTLTGFVLLLCLCKHIYCHHPCAVNDQCSCVTKGDATDMYCELTVSFLEIHGNFTAIQTLTLTSGPGVFQAGSNFTFLQVRHLVITGVSIADLDCNMLKGLTGLESVTIQYTKLSAIPKCALLQADNITSLSLNHNSVQKLHRRAFSDVPTVRHLNLTGNCLVGLQNDTLEGIQRLEVLDLSDNCIPGKFNSAAFSTQQNLKWLSLAKNKISAIPEDLWRYLPQLEFVDLSENELFHVDSMLFYPQSTFVINLSKNMLQSLRNLRVEFQRQHNGFANLALYVDASGNSLTQFDGVAVDGPQQCELHVDIKADDNEIPVFDWDPVIGTACGDNIQLHLSMARNKLAQFPPCHLSLLHRFHFQLLNMSGNSIEGKVNQLCGASEVKTLDLSNNKLSEIGKIVSLGGKLENLMLAGNKIAHIGENDFTSEDIKSNLKLIDLRRNSITSITETLNHCPKVVTIYLSHNPLDCELNETYIGDYSNLCDFMDTLDDARCLYPPNLRAIQVRCALGENCSSADMGRCWNDSYVEADLKAHPNDRGLNLHWNLIGPGQENVSQFLISVIRLRDNVIVTNVFVHRLERNHTVSTLHSGEQYKVCITVFVNIVTSKRCVETIGITSPPPPENIQLWIIVTIVVLGTIIVILVVVLSFYAIHRCLKSRQMSRNQTNPKELALFAPRNQITDKDSVYEDEPQAHVASRGYTEGPSWQTVPPQHSSLDIDEREQNKTKQNDTLKTGTKTNSPIPRAAHIKLGEDDDDICRDQSSLCDQPASIFSEAETLSKGYSKRSGDTVPCTGNRQDYLTPAPHQRTAAKSESGLRTCETKLPQGLPEKDCEVKADNPSSPTSGSSGPSSETKPTLKESSNQGPYSDISVPPRSLCQAEHEAVTVDVYGISGIQNKDSSQTFGDQERYDRFSSRSDNTCATYACPSRPRLCGNNKLVYHNVPDSNSTFVANITGDVKFVRDTPLEEPQKSCDGISDNCSQEELSEIITDDMLFGATSAADPSVDKLDNICNNDDQTSVIDLREEELDIGCDLTTGSDSQIKESKGICDSVSVKATDKIVPCTFPSNNVDKPDASENTKLYVGCSQELETNDDQHATTFKRDDFDQNWKFNIENPSSDESSGFISDSVDKCCCDQTYASSEA